MVIITNLPLVISIYLYSSSFFLSNPSLPVHSLVYQYTFSEEMDLRFSRKKCMQLTKWIIVHQEDKILITLSQTRSCYFYFRKLISIKVVKDVANQMAKPSKESLWQTISCSSSRTKISSVFSQKRRDLSLAPDTINRPFELTAMHVTWL